MIQKIQKFLGVILLLVVGILIGRYSFPALYIQEPVSGADAFAASPFWETWNELHENFIGTLDGKKLSYGAVEGMVRASGDAYTAFSDPESTKQFKKD